MKISIRALIFLAVVLGFGWLIFGHGGQAGDIALGFLIGLVSCVVAGTFLVKREKGEGG